METEDLVAAGFPRFRPIAGHALLVEFGEEISDAVHAKVMRLDAGLRGMAAPGYIECVPAYASVLMAFDPLVTDHREMRRQVELLLDVTGEEEKTPGIRDVDVCYDAELAPDLNAVAASAGLKVDEVIEAHLSGDYKVFMYGFAPGYAYLAGVPESIRQPRKGAAVRGVAAGSVLIAGPQCLVTTLTMPTGWWVIGRSPTRVLDAGNAERPFLFDVGDKVVFRRISRQAFEAARPL